MTLSDFLSQTGLKFSVRPVDSRPGQKDWSPGSRHFHFTISRNGQRMQGYFSQGSAYTDDPTLEDVLECLASDTANIGTFEDFCSNYGYETDSIRALKTFRACERELTRMQRLFSADELNTLWFEIEYA